MPFWMQGTKVFIKLELRKIHLYFAVFIHSTFVNLSKDDSYVLQVQIGCIGYRRVNKSDIYVNHKHRDIV